MKEREKILLLKHKKFDLVTLNAMLLVNNGYVDIGTENEYTLKIDEIAGLSLVNKQTNKRDIPNTTSINDFLSMYTAKYCCNITDSKMPYVVQLMDTILKIENERLNQIVEAFKPANLHCYFPVLNYEDYIISHQISKYDRVYIVHDEGVHYDYFNNIPEHKVWLAIASKHQFKELIIFDIINNKEHEITNDVDEIIYLKVKPLEVVNVETARNISTLIKTMNSADKQKIRISTEAFKNYNEHLSNKNKAKEQKKGSRKKTIKSSTKQ